MGNEITEDDFVNCFGHDSGRRMIEHLKEKFQTGLPLFQKKENRQNHDDPLYDALIRDGQHEVVRHIESETNYAYTNNE